MPGVIVEGCDGSGKTSLIRALRNYTFWPVCHVVQPHKPNVPQMLELAACAPMIFDRFHLSPVAYGEALRQGPELDAYDLWGIEGFLMGRGYTLIWCNTDVNTMVSNNKKAEQLWEQTREAQSVYEIVKVYQRAVTQSCLPTKVYNYQKDAPETAIDRVVEALPLGIVGTRKPKRWLVGDEKQQTREGVMEYVPFYTPFVGHQLLSGTLLQRTMNKIGWSWNHVAMSNSAVDGKVAPLAEWYELLGRPKVIALGQEAQGRLDKADVPSHVVTHPQYKRRFHHRTCEQDYPEELRHAA